MGTVGAGGAMRNGNTVNEASAANRQRSLLTKEDRLAIDRAIHSIYELQDLDAFVVEAMRVLPPLIQADLSAYNEVNYAERRMMTIIDSPTAQRWYHANQVTFEANMHQNPLIEYNSRTRAGPIKISDFISHKKWRDTTIYKSVYSEISGEHQIAVALPVDDETIVAFAFNRRESDFTERHREILAVLQPHLTQAYENARRYGRVKLRARRSEEVLESLGAGWFELDADFIVRRASAHALACLTEFFEWQTREGDPAPTPVVAWVRENIDDALIRTPIAPLIVNNGYDRLMLRLLSADDDGTCCLIGERILAYTSHEPLQDLGLTRRQAEVLYWILHGKTNSEIAVMLRISVRTVIFHVSRILEILGVANRTEAANVASSHLVVQRQGAAFDPRR